MSRPWIPCVLSAFVLLGDLGCVAAPAPSAAVVTLGERGSRVAPDPKPTGAVIVWRADPASALGVASEWIEPSQGGLGGVVIARRAEPIVVTKRGLVALRLVRSRPVLSSCEACSAGSCEPSGELGDVAALVAFDLAGDRAEPLTKDDDAPKSVDDAVGDFEVGVDVHGAVGPVVFFRRAGSAYGCGAAHPFFFAQPEAIDLDSGANRVFEPPRHVAAQLAATAKKALNEQHGGCLLEPEETPTLFEVSPEIGRAGLRANYTFVMAAPYVCGIGPDHYSVDHTVGSADAPQGLGMSLPRWLLPALSSGPVTGVGIVPEADRSMRLDAFRSAPLGRP